MKRFLIITAILAYLILGNGTVWMTFSQEVTSPSKELINLADTLVKNEPSVKKTDSALAKIAGTTWKITFEKVFWSFLVFLVFLFLLRYIARFLEKVGETRTRYRHTIKGIIPVIRILGWTLGFYIIIANIIAPPIATLLAILASAGIAVGFAAQDILKNIFGGILIVFDRPFQVGDKIEVGKYYGEVIDIGLRTVRIVTPDDSVVTIPNNEIVNTSVSNANNGESNCQVVAELYLPPDIDIVKVRKIATLSAAVSRYVYLNKPIVVIFKNEISEGRSLLKMRLKAYVLDVRYEFPFMSEMTETVIRELLQQGVVKKEDLKYNVHS
ncbi:MAG: mechanosensitive ion channel family protein [Bacteroidetes bacterium]|nr:mechanosensitive ion channel family protein [Bacteroidota bacterium]